MKNVKLNMLRGCTGSAAFVGDTPCQTRKRHDNDTATTRSRHGNGCFRFRTLTLLILFLTLGMGQMWAEPYMSGFGIQFRDDGGTWFKTGTKDNCSSGIMDCDFGSKTNLKIVYVYANGNKNGGNLCGDNYFKYEIYGETGTANWDGINRGSCNWSGEVPTYKWGTENSSTAWIDLVKDRKPGDYSMQFIMSFNGNSSSSGCGSWFDCKYSGQNWYFTWSIPDPTITITGASSLVVGTSTNIKATITNYPIGATVTKVRVTGNIASAKETTGSASNLTVSSVVPNASGANGITVTVTVTYGTGGSVDYTYYYNVSPPAVSSFSVSESNHLAGDGTSTSNAYILPYNGTLSLSISGSKAATDANSAAQYYNTSASGNWSTTSTKSISGITSTTAANTTVKMRYQNSTTSSLVGAESTKTIYYKSEARFNISASASPVAGGTVTPTLATATGQYSGGDITASHADGYTFSSWSIVTGSGYFGSTGTSTTSSTANTKFRPTAAATLRATFTPNEYTVNLNNQGADLRAGTASVTATFDATTNLTSAITTPQKSGYAFAGYYTEEGGNGSKLIDEDGNWIASVSGYTGDDSGDPTWKYYASDELELYAKWTPVALTFKADASTSAWGTASNWNPACVPTSGHDVTIKKAVIVSGAAEAKSIAFDGGSLTIASDGVLEVAGTITNTEASKIIIESDVDEQGALIYDISQTAPHATVNMKIAIASNFHYIASPVGYVPVDPTFAGSGVYTYAWIEGKGWEHRGFYEGFSGDEVILINGKSDCTFSGQLNPTITHSVTCTVTPANANAQGVNMVPNTLTAPIKISAMNLSDAYEGAVHIWNGSTWDKYAKYSCGEAAVIPALQGYAVITETGGTVSFDYTTAVRGASSHNDALNAPKRTNSDILDHITVFVSTNDRKVDLQLYENEQFSSAMDKGWEALYMDGDGSLGELYAHAKEPMSILATDNLEGTVLGFVPGQAEIYTISFEGDGRGYYLNDVKMEEATLIAEGNTYDFTPDESDNSARFVISKTPIKYVPTSLDTNHSDGIKARKQLINGSLYVIREGKIYNVEGMLVK